MSRLPPIEVDPDMPSREYIPLPGGWEVQTKGKGSSYRLLDRKTGERHLILCNDAEFIHDFVTRMAKEVHAEFANRDALFDEMVEALEQCERTLGEVAKIIKPMANEAALVSARAVLAKAREAGK